jgi:hypothetical protein
MWSLPARRSSLAVARCRNRSGSGPYGQYTPVQDDLLCKLGQGRCCQALPAERASSVRRGRPCSAPSRPWRTSCDAAELGRFRRTGGRTGDPRRAGGSSTVASMATACSVSRRSEHDDVRLGFDAGREYRATGGSMELGAQPGGGQVALGVRRAHARTRSHAARGPGLARFTMWARRTGRKWTDVIMARSPVHSDDFDVSVHRNSERKPRGWRGPDALMTRWARRRCRPSPVLFRLSPFEIAKLEKVSSNLKISENKSCRGAIVLQLSQRATWCLSNGLSGNVGRSWQNSRPGLLFKTALTKFLGIFHL